MNTHLDPQYMTEKQLKETIAELEKILATDQVTRSDVMQLQMLKETLAVIENAKQGKTWADYVEKRKQRTSVHALPRGREENDQEGGSGIVLA